ncbi:MAG: HAMP domain-containing protein [Gammaproteobacteria bacterium]|nr:HAMP domain-containing protein [Gammaproteobacteria bacterium]
MEFRALVKKVSGPVPVISVCSVLLLSVCFLIMQSLSEGASGKLQFWITLLGGIGILILVFFLVTNCYSLYRQYSRNEIGSKLTAKLVVIFFLLTIIPFSLIYFFSIQFLNKGVDSWFDVRVEQAVQDALFLGQASLEGVLEDMKSDVENYANTLSEDLDAGTVNKLLRDMEDVRELEDYVELSILTDDGRILAFSASSNSINMLPDAPGPEVFIELRIPQTYTSLEPLTNNTQQFRVVAPIGAQELGSTIYALQAIKLLPLSYANLASSVESAFNQYDQMLFARGPLRFSLILTLSLISLASLLFAILTAVYLSKRMVAPISNLAAGTQKIAEGDYGARLPVTTTDELGILTDSFNNMSIKIQDAQTAARSSQQETERQKAYLEAVLTNLSSGVFSFDHSGKLQLCNSAAVDILGLNLKGSLGQTTDQLAQQYPQVEKFISAIDFGLESGQPEWQDEVTVLGKHGRQILIMRGTLLHKGIYTEAYSSSEQVSSDHTNTNNSYVVVFDDVTNLIQAQRDAAWGEVARRLAHEIKNPLTPIQLSAERIRKKFANHVDSELRETLDRSTRTIVQQVESMKEMVNAFSSYAQPVRATLRPLDVNQLIRDVVELHTSNLQGVDVDLRLDPALPEIKANASALRQVFNNLIINAYHALENTSNAKLVITAGAALQIAGNYIDVVIEDNGSGVPPDIRDSLFDPYVSSKAKGSGLGLAIVKRIVEEHSGSVWVGDSQFGGTAMHLRLPINAMQTYRGNRGQNTLHSSQRTN